MPPEVAVRLDGPLRSSRKEELGLSIDGKPTRMSLRISSLGEQLVATLPDVLHDLIDIAATVYAADCAVSRGGLTDAGAGKDWRRSFRLEVPVRRPETWVREDVVSALRETLGFLSDDLWHFVFRPRQTGGPTQGIFDYGVGTGFSPGRVVMFSGGLDSFAGAVGEVIEREETVALVSHSSATKLAKVQRELVAEVRNRTDRGRVMHVAVTAQLGGGARKEGTQRSRSFLFAALGISVAELFGIKAVSFYENGVVSINLPPVGPVLGGRATRTTHPRVLRLFGDLFSKLLGGARRVSNPYRHHTKAEVVDAIVRLGFADQIRFTHSCADVHNRTVMHSHCGRCSQCIDRRFAILSRGLERHDPAESYAVDLMTGRRRDGTDREMALSYVRNARFFAHASLAEILARFPELARAIDETERSADEELRRLHDLHRRHGAAVSAVVHRALEDVSARADPESLLELYRAAQLSDLIAPVSPVPEPALEPKIDLVLDRDRSFAKLGDFGVLSGSGFRLLDALAATHLAALGRGRAPEDMPFMTAAHLMDELGFADEGSARRAIMRTRTKIEKIFKAAGRPQLELIETLTPNGYRLIPESVQVLVAEARRQSAGRVSRRASRGGGH